MAEIKNFELEKLIREGPGFTEMIKMQGDELRDAGDVFLNALLKYEIKEMLFSASGYIISVTKEESPK